MADSATPRGLHADPIRQRSEPSFPAAAALPQRRLSFLFLLINFSKIRADWFSNVRGDVLAGIVVALAAEARFADALRLFLLPDVPLDLQTLTIIFPYALTLAVVGLLEPMMTASIVDEMTDTTSDKSRECIGQGVANMATGLVGGMAGCAMIGKSVIDV